MILHGDCLQLAKSVEQESFHAIITDPPYGIEWLGSEWDIPGNLWDKRQMDYPSARGSVGNPNLNAYDAGEKFYFWFKPIAGEMFRTLKTGGSCFVFSHTRTMHHPMRALEESGFEIKDVLMWNYHTGFPKAISVPYLIDRRAGVVSKSDPEGHVPISQDAQRFDGWVVGRAKPAWEPIIWAVKAPQVAIDSMLEDGIGGFRKGDGKFPANIVVVNGELINKPKFSIMYETKQYDQAIDIPKPSRPEKDMGLEHLQDNPISGDVWDKKLVCRNCGVSVRKPETTCGCGDSVLEWKKTRREAVRNTHPTVKPIALFEHLIYLVTGSGDLVADFFEGSGTCAIACKKMGREHVGMEQDEEYYKIATTRVANVFNTYDPWDF